MTSHERDNRTDSGIPELDHLHPLTRGGSNARDNLVYACRRCNQRKSIRTADELARMPDDPISHMHCDPAVIGMGMELEASGYISP